MRSFILIISLFTLAFLPLTISFAFADEGAPSDQQQKPTHGDILISIKNLRNLSKGKLWVMLVKKVDRVDADLKKSWKKQSLKVKKGSLQAQFKNIPFGEYAVAIFHDLDADKELTTNWIGIPREDLCISNNVKGGPFGGPKWKDAKFKHSSPKTKIKTLKMVHMWKD